MSLEHLKYCPICQNEDFSHFLTCKDYTVSFERFDIVQCDNCGFLFTNPRPKQSVINEYYQSEEYVSHSNTKKGLINRLYHVVRNRALKSKLKLVNRLYNASLTDKKQDKRILDYGCGTGEFLNICQLGGDLQSSKCCRLICFHFVFCKSSVVRSNDRRECISTTLDAVLAELIRNADQREVLRINDPAMRSAGFESGKFQICTEPIVYILFLFYSL